MGDLEEGRNKENQAENEFHPVRTCRWSVEEQLLRVGSRGEKITKLHRKIFVDRLTNEEEEAMLCRKKWKN